MVRVNLGGSKSTVTRAFSLIELLVVIAIIALLAAIIFPVFFTVRENARASTSLSNLHDISSKLEQYKLDHGTYPPVLFGYAVPNPAGGYFPMDKALQQAEATNSASTYFPGLYPAYINNVSTFEDPDSTAKLTDIGSTKWLTTCVGSGNGQDDNACGNTPTDAGTIVLASHTLKNTTVLPNSYYAADAYDNSPLVTGTNQISTTTANYVTRYQLGWTSITDNGTPTKLGLTPIAPDTETAQTLYMRQLRWKYPPGNTYVTCTTWHVPQSNKVLILTQDGTAKKMDVSVFLSQGADAQLSDPSSNGIESAPFWRLTP